MKSFNLMPSTEMPIKVLYSLFSMRFLTLKKGEQASADELKEFFPGLKFDDVIKTVRFFFMGYELIITK